MTTNSWRQPQLEFSDILERGYVQIPEPYCRPVTLSGAERSREMILLCGSPISLAVWR